MKSFKNFLKLKEDITKTINSLYEANVHEPRYAFGAQVVLKPGGNVIEKFKEKLKVAGITSKVNGDTVFTKIKPKTKLVVVDLGGDNKIETFLSFGSKSIKLKGNPNGWFNKIKTSDGINWAAPQLETAAILGLFLNGNKMAKDIEAGKNVVDWKIKIKKVLGNGEDWFGQGSESILKNLKNMSTGDFNQVAMLASGMTSFKNNIVSFKTVHVIHGRIGQYYGAERENQSVTGNKDNTADCIVSNKSADETIEAMKTKKAKYNKKDGMVTLGDVKLYQLSLKKSLTGAQLGKITKNVLARYNINANTLFNTIMESNDINEGFMDWIKGVGQKVIDVVSNLFKKFTSMFNQVANSLLSPTVWSKQAKKDEKIFEELTDIDNLSECFIPSDGQMILNESMLTETKKQSITQNLKKMSDTNKNKLLKTVDKRLDKTKKIFKPDSLLYKKDSDLKRAPSTPDEIFKLFSNFVSIKVLNDIMGQGKYNNKQLVKEIIDLQREMYFGRTELPLWKVYGASDSSDKATYSYLSTGKEFVDKKVKLLSNKDIVLCAVRINLNSSRSYYTIQCSFVLGVDDDGTPRYNLIRTGTNQAGKFSFIIEGTTEHDYEYFQKTYR